MGNHDQAIVCRDQHICQSAAASYTVSFWIAKMSRLLSLLFNVFLTLLMFAQPANAAGVYPTSIEVEFPYPTYDPIIVIRHKSFFVNRDPARTFISDGPLFTDDQFRYSVICPSGSYSANNACYTRLSTQDPEGETCLKRDRIKDICAVRPAAVFISTSYNMDSDLDTNEQILYTAKITENDIEYIANNSFQQAPVQDGDLNSDNLGNPRRRITYTCPGGATYQPPAVCGS